MLVTGARKGIGRHLSEHYLEQGWTVAGCSRGASDLKHENYSHHPLDVADEKACRAMVAAVARKHGRIDALLNNAGVTTMNHVLLTPLSAVEEILRTNYVGAFLFAREAAKVMSRRKFGRIVNFVSVAIPLDLEGESTYAASKSAVLTMTRIMAREVASFGITCNAVGPAPTQTDIIKDYAEQTKKIVERMPIRRYGELRDVSNAVDFFIRSESDFVTGQVLYLGGLC